MRSAIYYGPHDVRIEDVPEPEVGPGQVKLRVAHNGVCGSDLHEYFAAATFVPVEPHPQTGIKAPVTLGHEFSGTVVAVGEGVTDVAVGDRAAVRPTYSCGACASCRAGAPNTCRVLAFHGLSGPGGGLSEYTVVDAGMVFPLPEGVSLEMGALVEPMAVSYHAVKLSGIQPGQVAIIAGLGPIGVGLFFALRALGVTDIIASDPSTARREILRRLGAQTVVDPHETDLTQLSREMSDDLGAFAVFDAAGVGAAIISGIAALAPQGKVSSWASTRSRWSSIRPRCCLARRRSSPLWCTPMRTTATSSTGWPEARSPPTSGSTTRPWMTCCPSTTTCEPVAV